MYEPDIPDTLFILGAGASKPYGFPTAEELRSSIIQDIKFYEQPEYGIKSQVEELIEYSKHRRDTSMSNYTWADFEAFAEDFERSGITSIDAFLEARREYEEVGKIALALELIPEEHPGNLFDHRNDDWYEWLIDQLYRGPEGVVSGNVRVITFNYDRSLEKRFVGALSSRFDTTREEALDLFEGMVDVTHVYGKLGDMRESSDEFREYAPNDNDPEAVLTAAKNVRLMYEVRESDAEQDFKESFEWANNICFLGFGYHQENLDLLGIGDLNIDNDQIYGTTHGMTGNRRRVLVEFFNNVFSATYVGNGLPGFEGQKCLDFLESNPALTG